MAEHELDRADRHLLRLPIAGTSLAEPMEVVMLADRVRFACHLNLAGRMIPACRPGCRAIATVRARPESYPL